MLDNRAADEYESSEEMLIRVEHNPSVNYVLHQNGFPLISKIYIENQTDKTFSNLRITIKSEQGFLIEKSVYASLGPYASIDLIANEVQELSKINADYLLNQTERTRGNFSVTVFDDRRLAEWTSDDVSIIPFDHFPGLSEPRLISAYVTPNSQPVKFFTSKVSDLLRNVGLSPSLEGYQSNDRGRIKQMVTAVYHAVENLNLIYSSIPPSYEESGQKIRGADEIMNMKMGNCLDLTLFFASIFENINLNPIIIFSEGHAFVGVWFINETLPDDISYDKSLILKLVDNDDLCIFESTGVTNGTNFDNAVAQAKNILYGNDFHFAVDVKLSRFFISPVPNRVVVDGRWSVERSERVPVTSVDGKVKTKYEMYTDESERTKFDFWKKKLLDTTLRNNLINMRNTKKIRPAMTADGVSLLRKIESGATFRLVPLSDEWRKQTNKAESPFLSSRYLPENVKNEIRKSGQNQIYFDTTDKDLEKNITALYRTSRTELEENGSNSLCLSLGVLKWYEESPTGLSRYAPLVLVPMEITRVASGEYRLKSTKEEPFFNPTLIEKMRTTYNLNIPFSDSLPTDDGGNIILDQVMQNVRQAVLSREGWEVTGGASLGIFSFSSYVMWKDLDVNEKLFQKNDIVKCLADNNQQFTTKAPSASSDPYDVCLTLPADSSQIRAVKAATNGTTFVLHGPPGTGKSQTITNIISDALYKGKTVLFVAEKMAALEVVKRRLDDIGIGDNCLELHSNKTSKATILGNLKKALECTKREAGIHNIDNSNYLKDQLLKEIDGFYRAMHRKGECSFSVWDAISEYEKINDSNLYHNKITICSNIVNLNRDELLNVRQLVNNASEIVNRVDINSNLLNSVKTEKFDYVKRERCAEIIEEIKNLISSMTRTHNELLEHNSPVKDIDKQIRLSKYIGSYDEDIMNDGHLDDFLNIFVNMGSHMKFIHNSLKKAVQSNYDRPFNFEEFNASVKNLKTTADSILGPIKHRSEAGTLYELVDLCDHVSTSVEGINLLFEKVSENWESSILSLMRFDKIDEEWVRISGLSPLKKMIGKQRFMKKIKPALRDPRIKFENIGLMLRLPRNLDNGLKEIREEFEKIIEAISSYDLSETLRIYENAANNQKKIIEILGNDIEHIDKICEVSRKHSDKIEKLIKDFEEYDQNISELEKILLTDISREPELCEDYCSAINENLDNLIVFSQWNAIKNKLDSLKLSTVHNVLIKGYDPNLLSRSFDKAYFEKVAKEGIYSSKDLYNFDGVSFARSINNFKKIDKGIRERNQRLLGTVIRKRFIQLEEDKRYPSEMRELNKRAAQSRPRISMRNLFSDTQNALKALCPCMLMSPLSVAQYLTPDFSKFDIVIFDEASQIPTHKAIGALSRAKSAVIVGDPKQLPPTTFFETKIELDDEEEYLDDLDSFLDDSLALSLPELYLEWHYRSKHESLIAFSNSIFYGNGMLTFPSVDDKDRRVKLEYIKGIYEKGKRTNVEEAEALARDVIRRLRNPLLREKSIGIVTLNLAQANLIENLLNRYLSADDESAKYAFDGEEKLIIKNLENIQGDERDVVLISINYGPDKNGKISTNFGPINKSGGEKRLNVAISRAREEMVVFSSMKSDMIPTSSTSPKGVIILKEFLQYAENGGRFSQSNTPKDHGVGKSIASELIRLGYEVDTDVGKSDFRVDVAIKDPKEPSRYLCGVVCDSPSNPKLNTRDREFAREDNLKRLGWKIVNIESVDWFLNKNKTLSKLEGQLKLWAGI